MQFHGVQFLDRRLIQHGVSFRVFGLLQQSGRRIVVMSAAHVFMPGAGPFRLQRKGGLPIERAFQNRLQALIGAGLQLRAARWLAASSLGIGVGLRQTA